MDVPRGAARDRHVELRRAHDPYSARARPRAHHRDGRPQRRDTLRITFCTTKRVTLALVATLTIRTDEQTERALAELTEDGTDRSTAARAAIMQAALLHRAEKLKAEAQVLAADPDDRAEIAAVRRDLEDLSAW